MVLCTFNQVRARYNVFIHLSIYFCCRIKKHIVSSITYIPSSTQKSIFITGYRISMTCCTALVGTFTIIVISMVNTSHFCPTRYLIIPCCNGKQIFCTIVSKIACLIPFVVPIICLVSTVHTTENNLCPISRGCFNFKYSIVISICHTNPSIFIGRIIEEISSITSTIFIPWTRSQIKLFTASEIHCTCTEN